ncbi:MAG: hypothetical protein ACI805_002916, partial [Candidatus Azotimanducaceae bacterium]
DLPVQIKSSISKVRSEFRVLFQASLPVFRKYLMQRCTFGLHRFYIGKAGGGEQP